ncbi:MAG: hypothetical protein ACYC64_07330 [Armatimonadota bacterium]
MKLVTLIICVCMVFVLVAGVTAQEIKPLAMTNRAIGGGALNIYTPGVENGTGTNNIGLLIKTWGVVTYVDTSTTPTYFYIDDGSGLQDGSGHKGVRVAIDNLATGNSITPPSETQHAAIVCISSTISINGKIQPNLRPRRQTDIQTF